MINPWFVLLALTVGALVYVYGKRRFEEGMQAVVRDFDDLHEMLDECVVTLRGLYKASTGQYASQSEMEQWIKRAEWLIIETAEHVPDEEPVTTL